MSRGYVRCGRMTSGSWRFGFEWDADGLVLRVCDGWLYFGRVR